MTPKDNNNTKFVGPFIKKINGLSIWKEQICPLIAPRF